MLDGAAETVPAQLKVDSADPGRAAQLRTAEGLPKKDIVRCLKRYVAREVYPYLRG